MPRTGPISTNTSLAVVAPSAGRFDVNGSGSNMGVELRNTAGGLTFFDFTSHPTRDFDLRIVVNADGTQGIFSGRPELSFFFDRPSTFTEGLWLINAAGSKSLSFAGATATQENIDFFVGPNLTWRLLRAPTSGDLILQRYVAGAYQENLLAFANATGQITLAKTVFSVDPLYLRASTPSGTASLQQWETDGVRRWMVGKGSAAETGGNTGSGFVFVSYDDAGNLLNTPLALLRTGLVRVDSFAIDNRLGSYDGTPPTNGQLLIGNGTNFQKATLTAGAGVDVTNSAGAITIAKRQPTFVEFTTSQTYNIPANLQGFSALMIEAIGAGGGGGGGRADAVSTARGGGAGGNGGHYNQYWVPASEIVGSQFVVTIGAGGIGGITPNTAANGTAGADGSQGQITSNSIIIARGFPGRGGPGGTNTTSTAPPQIASQGIAGGLGGTGSPTSATAGGSASMAAGGGGGGGGLNASNSTTSGGNGGRGSAGQRITDGAAGTGGNLIAGTNATAPTGLLAGHGGGGAGGTTTNALTGGDGNRGGGGGGANGSTTGFNSAGTRRGGNGGDEVYRVWFIY